MRKRAKALITFILSLLLLFNVIGSSAHVYAQGAHVIAHKTEVYVLVPGETTTMKIPIKAMGADVYSPVFLIDTADTPYTATQPVLHTDSFSNPPDVIYKYVEQYLQFDITVAESAKIGNYSFKITVLGTYYEDWEGATPLSSDITINTKILEEKEEAQLTINQVLIENPTIGQDMNLSFKVKNEGEIAARNVFVSIDYAETGMIAGYPIKKIKVDDILSRKDTAVSLPIKILPTAKPGIEVLKVNLTHKNDSGDEIVESYDIYVTLNENYNTPNLILSGFTYNEAPKAGDKLGLVLDVINSGRSTAKNPRIYVDEASLGTTKFIEDYYTDYIELKNIKADNTIKAEIPLIVSKRNTGGEQDIKLNLVYFDDDGIEYKSTVTIYLHIEAEGVTEDGTPIVIVSNVLQSPKQPKAGGRLEVSFDLENKSSVDLNELKLLLKNLTGNTFIPVDSNPYQYIGELKAGSIKRITIPLTVSEDISEGLSNLEIKYSYIGGEGDSINIPILDVKNELKDLDGTSKPKLIVSKYEADVDEIRAGAVFKLDFEIRNTHSSVAAKNIKLTVSGKSQNGQEVFTVTEGSNIFFVSKIGPGEIFSESLEMKVKSDTATGAYPINISMEYEYDGIKPNPTTGDIGEEEDNELILQVVENARPVVDYVQVYSWESGVIVGNPASLSFEFYNMGKSTLNNVVATVEGDFMSSGGSMYFLGNVASGANAYADFEVIPNVEGMAYGVVKITYEDSNGEEQVYTKEFETSVMGEQIWDPGMNGDGGMDVFNPTLPEAKKPILKLWVFIVIQVLIFIVFLLITRKVIISIYKSRLRKKEEIY